MFTRPSTRPARSFDGSTTPRPHVHGPQNNLQDLWTVHHALGASDLGQVQSWVRACLLHSIVLINQLIYLTVPSATVSTQTMPLPRARHTALRFVCPYNGCNKGCRSPGGLRRHTSAVHPKHVPPPVQPPVHAQSPAPSDRAFDEDDEDLRPGSVDPAAPLAQAVTHRHSIIDGQ